MDNEKSYAPTFPYDSSSYFQNVPVQCTVFSEPRNNGQAADGKTMIAQERQDPK